MSQMTQHTDDGHVVLHCTNCGHDYVKCPQTQSSGNSKDGWLTVAQIEKLRNEMNGVYDPNILCDMALYALTASSQEKRK